MDKKLYLIVWHVCCLNLEFLQYELKVFSSQEEASRYGKELVRELNGPEFPDELIDDLYYFKYIGVCPLEEVDGYRLQVVNPMEQLGTATAPVSGTL